MPASLKNIYKSYGEKEVIQNLSLDLPESGSVCFFGKSGIGKSTIFNIIAGLEKPDSGQILGLNDKKIAYVFQDDRLIKWLSTFENVSAVLKTKDKLEKTKCVKYWLEKFGLLEYTDAKPNKLSGGMKRKLAIARALAFDGDIILFDEPFKGLDDNTKKSVVDVIKQHSNDKLLIFITHDMGEIFSLSGTVYHFKEMPISGKINPKIIEN